MHQCPDSLHSDSLRSDPLPLVAVVIPAYNAEPWIARTLTSVLAQTYRNFEVWVVNDGSTDRTAERVERVAQQDARVKLLNQPNAGVAAARNFGIQQSQGELIAPIDADDLWHPEQLAKQVACFLAAPATVGLVYSWSVNIDEQDRPLGGFHAAEIAGAVFQTLLCHNFLGNASCTMMRRSYLRQAGAYNPDFQTQNAHGCEDWDLYLRLAELCQFRAVPEFLVGYRKLRQSMSYNYERMARSQALMLAGVHQRHPDLAAWLYRLSRSSLFLYFAHQAGENGQSQTALHWLGRAMRTDITPWLRLGSYHLGAKSLCSIGFTAFRQPRKPPMSSPHAVQAIPEYLLPDRDSGSKRTGYDQVISRWQVALKLLVGNILHFLISTRTPASHDYA